MYKKIFTAFFFMASAFASSQSYAQDSSQIKISTMIDDFANVMVGNREKIDAILADEISIEDFTYDMLSIEYDDNYRENIIPLNMIPIGSGIENFIDESEIADVNDETALFILVYALSNYRDNNGIMYRLVKRVGQNVELLGKSGNWFKIVDASLAEGSMKQDPTRTKEYLNDTKARLTIIDIGFGNFHFPSYLLTDFREWIATQNLWVR